MHIWMGESQQTTPLPCMAPPSLSFSSPLHPPHFFSSHFSGPPLLVMSLGEDFTKLGD